MAEIVEIVEVDAGETHDLRRRVLRDGTASDVVVFDGDDDPTTFHLAAVSGNRVVAISTWLERPHPDRPGERAFQLRGMATEPDRRGTGLGARLLAAGLDRCAVAGARRVWARARTTAVGFYEQHGFASVGPVYVDGTTGLDHRDIVHELIS